MVIGRRWNSAALVAGISTRNGGATGQTGSPARAPVMPASLSMPDVSKPIMPATLFRRIGNRVGQDFRHAVVQRARHADSLVGIRRIQVEKAIVIPKLH